MATIQEVVDEARSLLESQEVANYLNRFGVELDWADPGACIQRLWDLDPRKGGLARYELEEDSTEWPEETRSIIMACAVKMGMLEIETPLEDDWDLILAAGGARAANRDRLKFAAEAISKFLASGDLVIAGSERPLGQTEKKEETDTIEYDSCLHAVHEVEELYPEITIDDCIRIPGAKANTFDVLRGVFAAYPRIRSIAVVTTQIYWYFTRLDLANMAQTLPDIVKINVAGNPSDPAIVEKRTPATYVTEVNRAITAAVKLIAGIRT